MKNCFRIFSAVLLLCFLLTGCSGLLEDKTITSGELSITLPGTYVDLSSQDYASGLAFLYGFNNEAVLGIQEGRASLEAYMPEMTVMDYAELFVQSNELSCTIREQDGLPIFTYTGTAENTEFTYLCGVFMSDTYFWVVQFYCPTDDFADNQADFMRYLQTVQV